MKILHTSLECYPLAKVGGLADVVGSLPKYLNNSDTVAEVIIPYFDNDYCQKLEVVTVYSGTLNLGTKTFDFSIKKAETKKKLGFQIYLVHIESLLHRSNVYGYEDDTERFVSFQLAVLDWLLQVDEKPDVIHCHDHHTGLIPFMVSQVDKYQFLSDIPTVLTIHNAQYQGQFSYEKLNYIPQFNESHIGLLDWDQCINPLAAGIKCAWRVTTVSPSYMLELQQQANGLERLLAHENDKCIGILNGIDHDTWDPETDPMVIENYNIDTFISGRRVNKEWICNKFDLDIEKPLFAFIGRLVYEKGADLLPEVVSETLKHLDVNMLILGSGNKEVENHLLALKERFSDRYNTYIGYDEKLSHIIYAGADFLLMPSRVEPCGLNQMYSLRYGLIPIVRSIGGLKDTIVDIGDDGFGICHNKVNINDIFYSIKRGVEFYNDQKHYTETQKRIMKIDNSWNHSAKQYIQLYKSLKQLK
ncbi:glycogen synthase [Aquimarina sp. 2201CG5-10]|uniref:glycogen synthase n=1 Tax=Aquimarina callyspongiae TaxID=3098150 RepID=UPI002AB5DD92|nr:glycogen synthase [Aquimarina sp. 2201CG5-10]MDY8136118.1 glycogen synthase [Aquimarina sp. 2201CG5-10]